MPQTTQPSIDLPVPEPFAALAPDTVTHLARLTRDYARLSESQAGLSHLLGGAFLWMVALMEVTGHRWHFTWIGALSPLPLVAAIGAAALPFLWLVARQGLHIWATARFGLVESLEMPITATSRKERIRAFAGRFVLPGMILLGLAPILDEPLSVPFVRASLVVILALTLHFIFPRMKRRMDRLMTVLLFVGPALLLSGIQMAAGDTLLAYPLIGSAAIVLGIRDHFAFRKVKHELEAMTVTA